MIKSLLYSCFFLLIFSQKVFSQETISFDSFARYEYQENENTNPKKQIGTVFYNANGSNYYLVCWSKNNDVNSVRLYDKNKQVFYELKSNNFVENFAKNNLEVEYIHDIKTNNNISYKKEIQKESNIYIISPTQKNKRENEFNKYYIEFKPSEKKENQIGCHPDFHIRSMFNTFLDDLEGTVVKMYHIQNAKKIRIFTLNEMGKADFSINLKL